MHDIGKQYNIITNYRFYLVLTVLLNLFNFNSKCQDKETGYKLKTVVIDAGHGGKDPGAVIGKGKGKEKDITLSVALKLGELIEKNFSDVKVIYTRKTDVFVELFKRAQIANSNKADLFICVHVNSSKKADPFGSETYVMGLHKTVGNLEVAMTENSVITKEDNYQNQYEGFNPHSPEAFIIFSLYQNAYLEQSLNFASKIQNQYTNYAKRTNRGVKQAGFLVLWKTAMPSILTEVGFLSNPDEGEYLLNNFNQQKIAISIFKAFKEYKYELEGKTKTDTNENIEFENNPDTVPTNNIVNTDNIATDSVFFYVQVSSSVKKLDINSFKGLTNVTELNIDNSYKYVCEKTSVFSNALSSQKKIKSQFPDAFIIAIKDGKKIPVNEAIKQTKN